MFVAWDSIYKAVGITFRGTQKTSLENWETDLDTELVKADQHN